MAKEQNPGGIIAAVMIKSPIGAKPDAKKTLYLLGMKTVNTAILVSDSPIYRSMLQKAKDYVTWGSVSADFAEKVIASKGKLVGGGEKADSAKAKEAIEAVVSGKKLSDAGVKRDIHLHPPTGGFKGTLKRPITQKGEAGDRKEKMQALLERMI